MGATGARLPVNGEGGGGGAGLGAARRVLLAGLCMARVARLDRLDPLAAT